MSIYTSNGLTDRSGHLDERGYNSGELYPQNRGGITFKFGTSGTVSGVVNPVRSDWTYGAILSGALVSGYIRVSPTPIGTVDISKIGTLPSNPYLSSGVIYDQWPLYADRNRWASHPQYCAFYHSGGIFSGTVRTCTEMETVTEVCQTCHHYCTHNKVTVGGIGNYPATSGLILKTFCFQCAGYNELVGEFSSYEMCVRQTLAKDNMFRGMDVNTLPRWTIADRLEDLGRYYEASYIREKERENDPNKQTAGTAVS